MWQFPVRFNEASARIHSWAFGKPLALDRKLAILFAMLVPSSSSLAHPLALSSQHREVRPPETFAYLIPAQGLLSDGNPLLLPIGTPWADCRVMSNLDRAIEACTIVIDRGQVARNAKATALSNRCGAFQNKGMLNKAIADCDAAVKLDPSNFDAFYNRGRAKRKNGDLARAISDYSDAVRQSARSQKSVAKAYNNRGDAYAALGDTGRAIADFRQAIILDRTYAKAFYNRGAVRARKGDLDRAIKDYTRAIALEPNLARAFVARGNAFTRKSHLESAISDYKEALRIDKDDASARRSLERATAIVSSSPSNGSAAILEAPQDQLQME